MLEFLLASASRVYTLLQKKCTSIYSSSSGDPGSCQVCHMVLGEDHLTTLTWPWVGVSDLGSPGEPDEINMHFFWRRVYILVFVEYLESKWSGRVYNEEFYAMDGMISTLKKRNRFIFNEVHTLFQLNGSVDCIAYQSLWHIRCPPCWRIMFETTMVPLT